MVNKQSPKEIFKDRTVNILFEPEIEPGISTEHLHMPPLCHRIFILYRYFFQKLHAAKSIHNETEVIELYK